MLKKKHTNFASLEFKVGITLSKVAFAFLACEGAETDVTIAEK